MLEHDAPKPEADTAELLRNLRNRDAARAAPTPDRVQEVQTVHSVQEEVCFPVERRNSRVEDYLDHVLAPMVRSVAYDTRQEIRRDMRAHLAQLITAHEELGSDPTEAVTAALRQFGPPNVVAARWLNELPYTEPEALWRQPVTASVKQTLFSSARLLAICVAAWVAGGVFLDRSLNGGVLASLYLSLGAVLPLTVGYVTGRRHAGSRPILSMLLAQAAVLPFWPFLMMYLMGFFHHVGPDERAGWIAGGITFAALAPTGCLGAWLGAWQKKRSSKARRQIAA